MAAPNVSPNVTANAACDGLTFNDETVYTGSDITSSQVTTATLRVDYSTLETYIQYVFTVLNNVITGATLSLAGATPETITEELESTVFPLVDFDVTADYGITIPDVEDGVYYTQYRLQGTDDGEAFNYRGVQQIEIVCETACCIANLFVNLDPNCSCTDSSWMKAMRAQSYLWASQFATQGGNTENATAALNLASEICSGDCGCN